MGNQLIREKHMTRNKDGKKRMGKKGWVNIKAKHREKNIIAHTKIGRQIAGFIQTKYSEKQTKNLVNKHNTGKETYKIA